MKKKLAVSLVAVLSLGAGVGIGQANDRTDVKLRCPQLSEDSAAHVRMVKFERSPDGSVSVAYRCRSAGY